MKKPRVKTSREVLSHIDPSKKVRVYRNLHKNCFSVRQGSIVKCHVDNVVLKDCKFIVSEAGQRRVREEGRKNVHAYIEGFVIDARDSDRTPPGWENVYYNPYQCDGFVAGCYPNEVFVETAMYADLDKDDKLVLAYGIEGKVDELWD